jgi:cytochrome P450
VNSLLGDGIFTQDGAAWKRSRDLLRPHLFRKRFEDLKVFGQHVDNLIKCIPARGIVDLQPLFLRMTMDSATAFLFGKSVDTLSPDQAEDAEKFIDAFQYAQEYVKKRYQFGRLCWIMNGRKYQEACHTIHEFVDKFTLEAIEEHKSGQTVSDESEASSLLKNLVRQSQDPLELRSQLLHLLVGGRESLAALLSWTM